jgi:uncharacterized protein (DUF983 family)
MRVRRAIAIIFHGARRRCPRCGRGRLFDGWYTLRPQCAECGLNFDAVQDNTWAFMYVTTAMLTGVIIVALFFLAPRVVLTGQIFVGLAALALIVGTIPRRKGVAMAVEFILDRTWRNETKEYQSDRSSTEN